MTIKIALTYLIDFLYLALTLSGIILVGAFYLLPRAIYQENSFYKLLPEILEIRPEKPKEIILRMRAGEVVIIHPGGEWESDGYKDLFESIGLSKWIYLGVCRERGCVVRFIINNKEAIDCILSMNSSATISRSFKYIGGTKHLLMFDNNAAVSILQKCLLSNPLLSSDIDYVEGLRKEFVVNENGNDYIVRMVFVDKNCEINIVKKLDMVKVV